MYTLEINNSRYLSAGSDYKNYIDNITVGPADPDLMINGESNISVASGRIVFMIIDAGAAHAGEDYFLLASFDSYPGFTASGHYVPLVQDVVFDYSKKNANSSVFMNSKGVLDASGKATPWFNTLGPVDPAYVGKTISFAYVLLAGPGTPPVTHSSNKVMVSFIP